MRFAGPGRGNLHGVSSTIVRRRYLWALCLAVLTVLYGASSWAIQHHPLSSGQTETEHAVTPIGDNAHSPEPDRGPAGASAGQATETQPPQATAPLLPQVSSQAAPNLGVDGGKASTPQSLIPKDEGIPGDHDSTPEGLPEPEEEAKSHEQRGVVLPHISPTPGVTFVQTMINLMEHELRGRTLGWRPNDIIIGRFTDNINNFQLGVLEAMRHTTLRLKDSLTRMGDADAYDPDLEAALNLLMNRSTLFWFPSAETSYREAIDYLRSFLVKLETGKRNFYYRGDNLRLLLSTYKELLGNVNRNLIRRNVSWFESDDYFYYAKGVAHVYYEILKVVRVGFEIQLSTLDAVAMMDEVLYELHRAEQMDPWLVLNSDEDSFFANHRYNLNAPLSGVAHLLVVMTQL